MYRPNAEKSFQHFIKSTRNQIIFTRLYCIIRLYLFISYIIWNTGTGILEPAHIFWNISIQFERKTHSELSISFQIEWNMIVVTVFHFNFEPHGNHLVQNQKVNCRHDHVPFNSKGNGNLFWRVHVHTEKYFRKPEIILYSSW